MHGKGKFVWKKDGQKTKEYNGDFLDNLMTGFGEMKTYNNMKKYAGEFLADKKHGKGTLIYPDGRHLVGNWVKGHIEGKAFYEFPDGTKKKCVWKKGTLVKE